MERKRKRSAGGSRGSQLLGQLHAATAAHVQQSSQHKRTSELISGCWKENESSREAGLHVRLDGVFTVIPIQPCGFPVCHTVCERTARWQSRQRMASWGYRCTPMSVLLSPYTSKSSSKLFMLLVPVTALGLPCDSFPAQRNSCWPH